MKIGRTLYVWRRSEWRSWLARHHASTDEIWLVFTRKSSGKPRLPYAVAVEEALCYGWIDSILKKIDDERFAQRFSRRRPGSRVSALNLERIRRLAARGKMTTHGWKAAGGAAGLSEMTRRVAMAADIARALKQDSAAWSNFQRFPAAYRRVRVGWIERARRRPAVFARRLSYLVRTSALNRMFGSLR